MSRDNIQIALNVLLVLIVLSGAPTLAYRYYIVAKPTRSQSSLVTIEAVATGE